MDACTFRCPYPETNNGKSNLRNRLQIPVISIPMSSPPPGPAPTPPISMLVWFVFLTGLPGRLTSPNIEIGGMGAGSARRKQDYEKSVSRYLFPCMVSTYFQSIFINIIDFPGTRVSGSKKQWKLIKHVGAHHGGCMPTLLNRNLKISFAGAESKSQKFIRRRCS